MADDTGGAKPKKQSRPPGSGRDRSAKAKRKRQRERRNDRHDRWLGGRAANKVVVRRLPPGLSEEKFVEIISPFESECIGLYYALGDPVFGKGRFARAYIAFKTPESMVKFHGFMHGWKFQNAKGEVHIAIVERAPNPRWPRPSPRRPDKAEGTIEKDPDFLAFQESLSADVEPLPSAEVWLEDYLTQKQQGLLEDTDTAQLAAFIDAKHESRRQAQQARRRAADKNRGGGGKSHGPTKLLTFRNKNSGGAGGKGGGGGGKGGRRDDSGPPHSGKKSSKHGGDTEKRGRDRNSGGAANSDKNKRGGDGSNVSAKSKNSKQDTRKDSKHNGNSRKTDGHVGQHNGNDLNTKKIDSSSGDSHVGNAKDHGSDGGRGRKRNRNRGRGRGRGRGGRGGRGEGGNNAPNG